MSAVRELVTTIKFTVNRASLSVANNATNNLKTSLSRVSASARSASSGFSKFFSDFRSGFKTGFATEFNRLSQSSAQASKNIARVGTSASSAFASLRSLVGVMAAYVSVSKIKETADEMMNLDGRLRTITADDKERLAVEEDLYKVAQRSRRELSTTGDLFFKIARSGKDFGLSTEGALRATETISKALVVGGASTMEAQATSLQLGQALASGRLQGDEFRSLSENAPLLMGHIAKNLGVTIGELKDLSRQGALTTEVLLGAIAASAGVVDEEFAKMPKTIGQSLTVVANGFQKFIMDVERQTHVFSGTADIIIRGFDKMSKAVSVFSGKSKGISDPKKRQALFSEALQNGDLSTVRMITSWERLQKAIEEAGVQVDRFYLNNPERFERIRADFASVYDNLTEYGSIMAGILTPLIEPILTLGTTVVEFLSGTFASFLNGFISEMEQYGPEVQGIYDGIRKSIENISYSIEKLTPLARALSEWLGKRLADAVIVMGKIVVGVFEGITEIVASLIKGVDTFIRRWNEANSTRAEIDAQRGGWSGGGGYSGNTVNQEFTVTVPSTQDAVDYTNAVSDDGVQLFEGLG